MESVAARTQRDLNAYENDSNLEERIDPTTIITCPSCRTRFAVSTEAIVEVEDPRFHCSRCDALFSLDEVTLAPEPEKAPEASVAHEEQKVVEPTIEEPAQVETFSVSDFSLRSVESGVKDSVQNTVERSVEKLKEPEVGVRYQWNDLTGPDGRPNSFSPVRAPKKKEGWLASWFGAAILISILLACLTLLAVVSYVVRVDPSGAGALVQGVVPGIFEPSESLPPPSEFAISRSRLEWVELESGETLPVVYGKLSNSGEAAFSMVEMEALLFNSRGEVVAAARAPLRSALARERVSALNLSTVERFQGSITGKASSIGAKEGVDFVVAFPALARSENEPDPIGVRSYSSRVYQVRK